MGKKEDLSDFERGMVVGPRQLKYIFQVSVLYWSSFILSNFYFYFTTFQSIRSYFLLHYIS